MHFIINKLKSGALAGAIALLCGVLAFWASYTDKASEIDDLAENALCVLELQEGSPDAFTSFMITRTVDQFHVGVRPEAKGERLSLSISGSKGPSYNGPITEPTSFSLSGNIPPETTYTVSLSQEVGSHGGMVVISDEKLPSAHVTGWQIFSRTLLTLLILSGVWVFTVRKSANPQRRAVSAYTFQMLLLAFVVLFLYLLFHEGGHSLGEMLLGRFDLARSDFWGIHGHPHSGGISGPMLEPWQQTIITGGGLMLPTFAGWAFFLLWISRVGQRLRSNRPIMNLYLSAIVAALIFPSVVVAGCLAGVMKDGETQSFISNTPGPTWIVHGILWGVLLVNAFLLWRVVPELWRAWKTQVSALRNLPMHGANT